MVLSRYDSHSDKRGWYHPRPLPVKTRYTDLWSEQDKTILPERSGYHRHGYSKAMQYRKGLLECGHLRLPLPSLHVHL